LAVNHSPALTAGNEPRTVTSSRCPLTFTRSTANPLSSLKKVTRSTSPAISSDGVRDCGEELFIQMEFYSLKLPAWFASMMQVPEAIKVASA
jgi:hypothetical protein